jgi:hypothetical protein
MTENGRRLVGDASQEAADDGEKRLTAVKTFPTMTRRN